jgi:hypothetical protein
MKQITNISATEEAELALRAWQARHKLPSNQDCALVWVESYTEPDGSTVAGFKAGFMLGPIMKEGRDARWVLARLPEGTEFYVLPQLFHWSPVGWHLIENIKGFAMYSNRPVARP